MKNGGDDFETKLSRASERLRQAISDGRKNLNGNVNVPLLVKEITDPPKNTEVPTQTEEDFPVVNDVISTPSAT